MLLSMTGFGEARAEAEQLRVTVEVRTLNHRYLKVTIKGLEGYSALEGPIEQFIRDALRRGSVQVFVRIDRVPRPEDYLFNLTALRSYWEQLQQLREQWKVAAPLSLSELLVLPGVLEATATANFDTDLVWPVVQRSLEEAVGKLQGMRRREGAEMAKEFALHCRTVLEHLEAIDRRTPKVVEEYGDRLTQRVNTLLERLDLRVDQDELIKELSIFAERSDVSEEVVRLRSHLEQFRAALDEEPSAGRKLEFVSQEMVREANTIGSKANDVQISREVVAIKEAIERIRELVQNVE